jgi:hypothetical protein
MGAAAILFPIAVFISFGTSALAIWFALNWKNKNRERARGLASNLGLAYSEGLEAAESVAKEQGRESYSAKLEALPPILRRLLDKFAPWRISGEYCGVPVRIFPETRSSGKSSTTWLVVRALFRDTIPYKLRAGKESFFDKVGKTLFGLQDVEVGDFVFDEAIRIKASDPAAASVLFSRPETREALLNLISSWPGAVVTSECIQWERIIGKKAMEEVPTVLELMAVAAKAMA